MNNKTDLRIIKTKKTLGEALVKLMKEKNFERIKISDICEEALVNRSTFYAHYDDKYDLLVDLINDLKESLLDKLKDNESTDFSKEYLMELINTLIDHIANQKEIYTAILSNNRNGFLIDFLMDVIERDVSARLKTREDIKKSNVPLDTIIKFYVGGLINLGVSWLANGEKYTKKELLMYIDKLLPEKI